MKPLILILLFFPSLRGGDSAQIAECGGYRRVTRYEEVCCVKENLGRTFTQVLVDGTLSYLLCPSTRPSSCPVYNSCDDVLKYYPMAMSGYYNITTARGKEITVYCNMEESEECLGEKGWIRVAYVDMTKPGENCPTGLMEKQYENVTHSLCVNNYTGVEGMSCDATAFTTHSIAYSKVCGRVHGYQHGNGLGFSPTDQGFFDTADLFDVYLTGVSITHGARHIWSFASGWSEEVDNDFGAYSCPCTGNAGPSPPEYVGKNYYCESGRSSNAGSEKYLYIEDKLWDGQQCNSEESNCCMDNKMLWFHRSLTYNSTNDITLRVCGQKQKYLSGGDYKYWDTPIELIELYIK